MPTQQKVAARTIGEVGHPINTGTLKLSHRGCDAGLQKEQLQP
jgi:hypothetical protein